MSKNKNIMQVIRRRVAGGFTIIEIMVVIAIIIILCGIVLAVGSVVKSNAARRATVTTLKALEAAMDAYIKDGNPEPQVPAPLPSGFSATTPASDPVNFIKALHSDPKYWKGIETLPQSKDSAGEITILDGFGTPIRYVPYQANVTQPAGGTLAKEGYFWSAGANHAFENFTSGAAAQSDDVFSNQNQ